jgi:molybdopterin synthase catalytic subunit
MWVDLRDCPIVPSEVTAHVAHGGAGAIDLFVGLVRDVNDARPVVRLEYQAYAPMAIAEMRRICEEIEAHFQGVRVAVAHRTGSLEVGDIAVVCAASAVHRGEAFEACRKLIDEIKHRVPIWKREHGPDGAYWVGWQDARCHAEHP